MILSEITKLKYTYHFIFYFITKANRTFQLLQKINWCVHQHTRDMLPIFFTKSRQRASKTTKKSSAKFESKITYNSWKKTDQWFIFLISMDLKISKIDEIVGHFKSVFRKNIHFECQKLPIFGIKTSNLTTLCNSLLADGWLETIIILW